MSLECIRKEPTITAFHGVPTMFIAMLEHPDFEKTDFSNMRTGIMAGSPCPVKVMQDVVDKMHMSEICITYGQTEASPATTMSKTCLLYTSRRFAVALALVGDDAHDDVAERFNRAQRGLEGPRQRQGDASGLYIEYLQRLCASRK